MKYAPTLKSGSKYHRQNPKKQTNLLKSVQCASNLKKSRSDAIGNRRFPVILTQRWTPNAASLQLSMEGSIYSLYIISHIIYIVYIENIVYIVYIWRVGYFPG